MTDHTTDTTRRGKDTIEVAIPDGCPNPAIASPIHVEADVLYQAIDLLQVVAFTLDPFSSAASESPDPATWYRLRIALRRITTHLEEAVLADWPTNYGEPCRAYLADLAGRDEQARPR